MRTEFVLDALEQALYARQPDALAPQVASSRSGDGVLARTELAHQMLHLAARG
jgi:hypothetical protein